MTTLTRPEVQKIRLPFHVVDLACDELRNARGNHVDLRPRSFAVLRLLAENAGNLVTKDEIIDKVWGDVVVTDDSLTQCIADIRKAIGDEDRQILRTVPRKGYLLVSTQRTSELPGRVPDRPSLAVIPFRSLTRSEDGDLGCGVAGELVCELARNKDLRVIGRDSSFALASQPMRAQDLGEQLGVRYLVEGTAGRSKDTLTVDVQLVDARDGSITWGDRFTAKSEDIPEFQHTIACRIAGHLVSGMKEAEKRAILGRAPLNFDVYELTLRGIARKHQFTAEAYRAGRQDLNEALQRDPNYASAWAYLAWLNLIDMLLKLSGDWQFSRLGEVIGQFNRAIQLDPSLPSAYQGLSQALIYTGDTAQAVRMGRRAVELGPSDADGFLFLGVALFEDGAIEEALDNAQRAVDLNPMRPSYYCFFRAMILWGNERYQEALEEAEECLRKAPNFAGADTYRVLALVGLGRLDEAKAALARHMARPAGFLVVPPRPSELASRALGALQAAGWRPTVAAGREAG
ncbi:MAG: winged helix-turn-helix domain-containing tetratricopeptide repeat protein [Methyloceanibacter sp.]